MKKGTRKLWNQYYSKIELVNSSDSCLWRNKTDTQNKNNSLLEDLIIQTDAVGVNFGDVKQIGNFLSEKEDES